MADITAAVTSWSSTESSNSPSGATSIGTGLDDNLRAIQAGVKAWYDSVPLGAISGLTYANNSGDATNDIDIAAGRCTDATGAHIMVLAATLTKRLDASWVVGTNQ